MKRTPFLTLALVVGALIATSTASAATYAIEPCRYNFPNASAAAIVTASGSAGAVCVPNGYYLRARGFDSIAMTVKLPAGTPSQVTIAAISGTFGLSYGGHANQFRVTDSTSYLTHLLQTGGTPFIFDTGQNRSLESRSLTVSGSCDNCGGYPPIDNEIYMRDLRMLLNDPAMPTASFAATGLLSPGAKSGVQDLTFTVADGESGLHHVDVARDTGADRVFNGVCLNQSVAACTPSTTITTKVDTSALPPGPGRTVAVTLVDAAGNTIERRSPPFTVAGLVDSVVSPVTSAVQGTTPAGNAVTTDLAGGSRLPDAPSIPGATLGPLPKRKEVAKYTRPYAGKLTVQGLVLRDRLPAAGASVDISMTLDGPGAVPTRLATVVADAKGQYTYTVHPTASGTLTITPVGSTTGRRVEVRVVAGVELRAGSKRTVRGRAVKFSGRVKIDPFPTDPPRVAIQVRSAYGWQDVAFLRVRRDGTFAWSHAFRSAGAFRFRAKVLGQKDLGAVPGASTPVRLRIR